MNHVFPAVFYPYGTIDWAATNMTDVVTLTVVDDSRPALSDIYSAVHITVATLAPVADANGPCTI